MTFRNCAPLHRETISVVKVLWRGDPCRNQQPLTEMSMSAYNGRDLEQSILSDDELDMVTGGAAKLLDVKMPGLSLQYYDNGTATGTSTWGTVVNANGKVSSFPGLSGGA
jgi:hypothetical protein